MKKYKSPISWYGGKYYMAKDIIELFPEHQMYVEGFGGAAHILFRKEPSPMEVYNDIHSCLYQIFRILRTDSERDELLGKISLTPYSREEFNHCKRNWKTEESNIEKVRMFYVATMQAVANSGGWNYSKAKSRKGMSQAVSRWIGHVDDNLINAVERLREVQIENLDVVDLIKKYDKDTTLFYLDPPYIAETRVADKVYDHEMPTEKHIEMVEILLKVKGKVILSGYSNEIYSKLEDNGWTKVFLGDYTKRSQKNSTVAGEIPKGQEFVWINYKID